MCWVSARSGPHRTEGNGCSPPSTLYLPGPSPVPGRYLFLLPQGLKRVQKQTATVRNVSRERLARVSIPEAALRLGVTQSAVRQRIRRGSISWEKGEDGRTYVFISPDVTSARHVDKRSRDAALVEELRDRVRSLEEQIARRDAIMLSLTESLRQLEAPRDARESPESAVEEPTGTPPPQEQQEPSSRPERSPERQVPWWRRMFG